MNFKKLLSAAALLLIGGGISSVSAQTTLASWTFDNVYDVAANVYTPSNQAYVVNNQGSADLQLWFGANTPIIRPNSAIGALNDYALTAKTSRYWEFRTGYNNRVFRVVNDTQANNISNLENGAEHDNYFELSFPTTGYKNIALNFACTYGGNASVKLHALVSVDGGESWSNAGYYSTSPNWYTYTAGNVGIEATNKSNVIVRLIFENGRSSNWNMDYINVVGQELGDPLNIKTVTFYDVDQTSVLGSKNVYAGDIIGRMPVPNVTSGYRLRKWKLSNGTIVDNQTVVNENLDVYPYQTPIEVVSMNSEHHYNFTHADFDAVDYDILHVNYNDQQNNGHGLILWSGHSVTVEVAGNATISAGLCAYQTDNVVVKFSCNGVESDEFVGKASPDGQKFTWEYVGGGAGTVTLSVSKNDASSAYIYLHTLDVVNHSNTIDLDDKGYATYCNFVAVQVSGAEAFVGTVNGEYLSLTKIEDGVIPANTGVILKGEAGAAVTLSEAVTANTYPANALSGVAVRTASSTFTAEKDIYIYQKNSGKFVKYIGENIPSNKAFLLLDKAAASRSFIIDLGGVTGIQNLETEQAEAAEMTYDLFGREMSTERTGLKVKAGRVVMVK